MEYPIDFWRGISSKDFISCGWVLPEAFQFDKDVRDDGFKELSINWNDCENALQVALKRTKPNGKLQFVGATKLELSKVKSVLASFIEEGLFSYERREIDGNPYHGNLLLSGDIDKKRRSLVSSGLALVAGTNITYQPENQNN